MPNSEPTPTTAKPRILFDPASARFFDTRMAADVPATAIEISPARHAELMEAQAAGARIIADSNGRPRAKLPGHPELRRQLRDAIRTEARRRIFEVSPMWRQLNDLRHQSEAGTARFARIDAIRDASTLIEQNLAEVPATGLANFPVTTHLLWPEF